MLKDIVVFRTKFIYIVATLQKKRYSVSFTGHTKLFWK